jgi:hypothetical protein
VVLTYKEIVQKNTAINFLKNDFDLKQHALV